MNQNRCRHCHTIFLPNPRIKNQRYCNRPECQRARKALWQKQKMHQDPDYQDNHLDAQINWLKRNADYWKRYRAEHPAYVAKNRLNQKTRDRKRRLAHLAKMDTSAQKIFIIPDTSTDWSFLAKKDSIDFKGSSLFRMTARKETTMIHKEPLNPQRIRKITGSFAFIEHCFRRWIKHLGSEELLLYLFLVLAADEQGLSYYSPETICSHLNLSPNQYRQAFNGLIARDLIAFREPLFQVLSLPQRRNP